jgi:Protein of unknown function (DUF2510)
MAIFVGWAIIWLICAFITSTIAWNRTQDRAVTRNYFWVGLILGVFGIILAFQLKAPTPPPIAPGWYADPWGLAPARWHDGTQWTGHVQPVLAQ